MKGLHSTNMVIFLGVERVFKESCRPVKIKDMHERFAEIGIRVKLNNLSVWLFRAEMRGILTKYEHGHYWFNHASDIKTRGRYTSLSPYVSQSLPTFTPP